MGILTQGNTEIIIRGYHPEDWHKLAKLFYDTVHTVNAVHHRPEQCSIWASGEVDLDNWNASFLTNYIMVKRMRSIASCRGMLRMNAERSE